MPFSSNVETQVHFMLIIFHTRVNFFCDLYLTPAEPWLQWSVVQYSAVQYSVVQYTAVQYSVVQYSAE